MNILGFTLDLLGVAMLVLYFYVGVAMIRADRKAGFSWGAVLSRAAIWPATIWNSIEELHKARPPV